MKDNRKKLKAILLAGSITLAGSSLTGCGNKNSGADSNQVITVQYTTVHFGIGEHIISVPISPENDIRLNNVQYEYHPGYEPVGISITSNVAYKPDKFSGGAIIYANTEEVECSSNLVDKDGKYVYADFGMPIYYNEEEYDSSNNIKEFGIGEHIISVPINEDNRLEQFQYDYHEGYEVVGISVTSNGMYFPKDKFGGGVLLYKNITPVNCVRGEDNSYTTFGVPVEIEKTRTLK